MKIIFQSFRHLKIEMVFPNYLKKGTCKVRNEIETKRRYISFRSVSFRFVRFRFVLFDFVSFGFVSISFRTLQVPSFDSGFSKIDILELIVFN